MGMTLEKRRSTIQPHSFCSVLAAFISSFLCLNGHAYDPIALPPSTAPPAALETQPIPEEAQTLAATAKETCVDIVAFRQDAGKLYIPMEEASGLLALPALCECRTRALLVNGMTMTKEERIRCTNGTAVAAVTAPQNPEKCKPRKK